MIKNMLCNSQGCRQTLIKLKYRVQKDSTRHLVGLCEIHGWRYLPLVEDLKIPTTFKKLKSKETKSGKRIDILKEQKPPQQYLLEINDNNTTG